MISSICFQILLELTIDYYASLTINIENKFRSINPKRKMDG
jgi:hypothetical protein